VSQPHLFCEVILPLALKGTFTYRIPDGWEAWIRPGIRVEVSFGKRRIYTGLVRSIHGQSPQAYAAKELLGITDELPIVQEAQLKFWDWMAEYYCCYQGEVMQAALPSYFKLDSETHYLPNPDFNGDAKDFSDDEFLIFNALMHHEKLKLEDIQLIVQRKSVSKLIKSLLDKKVIYLEEYLEEKYKPRTEVFVRLLPDFQSREQLQVAFQHVQRSGKQTDFLLAYLEIAPSGDWVQRSVVMKRAEVNGTVVKALVDKGIFEAEERTVYRVREELLDVQAPPLSDAQEQVKASISAQWEEHAVVLLKGVTASGKTHVYAELIRRTIAEGRQVLYMLPEIALTTQLIQRLEDLLGKVGVYHSRFNPAERVETWYKVLQQEYNIVVGARSAMFLPFPNLGLVIVDEEHDASYKQQDPAPRYNARDSAIVLAHLYGAKVLLGSATPSMESWINVKNHRYGYVELNARFGEMVMPELSFINMSNARKESRVTGMISDELQAAIRKNINAGKQVIIFQNRRGYAPTISCRDCGWVAYCKNCDVSMTYHKFSDQLKCHYCGYSKTPPKSCPSCTSTVLEQKGMGTERVEDDLQALFPDARMLRMDYDTAKGKFAHERIIEQFAAQEADILVGTQMVTKGLDFKGVGLVGVLNADALLHYPDFRSLERAWQLLMQVSGRAGRSGDKGTVLVQIGNPRHPITDFVLSGDMESFYALEWAERKRFHYPPFNRLIHITIKEKLEKNAQEAAAFLFQQLVPRIQGECLGPGVPPLSRIQGLYLREILIKLPRTSAVLQSAKIAIEESRQLMYQFKQFSSTRLVIDVDP
jgi:primosomal protein N' (replication factor Y) (superfamily II helicase)